MKTIYVAFLFVSTVLSVSDSYAQSGWFWQNPLPQGNTLYGVSFSDANTGTALGGSGTILRTTNGGSSWMLQSSGTTNRLYGVSFTDANTGTAVGGYGTILRTTNGGSSWMLQSSRTTNNLYGVSFSDANTGTAVGDRGTIFRTTNGGSSWILQSRGTTNTLLGVSFTDANTGTAVGDGGTILRTNTGGVAAVMEEAASTIPSDFWLMQNYPNPFNPSTKIGFRVSGLGSSWVRLVVYDILGREVKVLVDEWKEPGSYEVMFDGSGLSSGVYLYRLQARSYVETKKLMLVR